MQDLPDAGDGAPATRAARTLVEGLLASGVGHAVLCPGSRSAPLAYAAYGADAAGAWRLHVRIDERSAGFLALGIGRATGHPAVVITTSGTAVANLAPAVLEAHHARVPLIVLSADRPAALRGSWANQTSDRQAGLFRGMARLSLDIAADPTPADGSPAATDWSAVANRAVEAACGLAGGPPGPVHVNVGFDDPLVPVDLDWRPAPVAGGGPAGRRGAPAEAALPLPAGPRTVVVAGDGAGPVARTLAEAAGWPLLAEPSSRARGGPNRVGAYRLLLDGDLGAAVERVVAVGRPTLSRPVTRLLARDDVDVVLVGPAHAPGPARPVTRAVSVTPPPPRDGDVGWLSAWTVAGARADRAVAEALGLERERTGGLSGPDVAAAVVAAAGPGSGLVLAASNPIRDADLAAREVTASLVMANRGLSGIDGTVSTAAGASLGAGLPVLALIGDLAFLHDANGLLRGPAEPSPRVRVVVVNDRGGGIFGLLEHGEERFAPAFDRLFGTPHDTDLAALCAAHGTRYRTVGTLEELRAALDRPVEDGIEVVEVPVRRDRERLLARLVRDAVAG